MIEKLTDEELREHYDSLVTDELINIYKTSELNEKASYILNQTLKERGVTSQELQSRITEEETLSCKPVITSLPKLWIGYVIAVVYFIYGMGEVIVNPSALDRVSYGLIIIYLMGLTYWFYCIYRIHWVLAEATSNKYPITPNAGAGFHLVPLFNFYWMFKWTNEVASYLNSQSDRKIMSKGWAGFFLLFGFFIMKIDASIGLFIFFTVTVYVARKIRRIVKFQTAD